MNTNMTKFRRFSNIFSSLCFLKKVASALQGLRHVLTFFCRFYYLIKQHRPSSGEICYDICVTFETCPTPLKSPNEYLT